MNPTLATRCQQRQHQVYWRMHPPGPFVVDGALPTALAVQRPGDGDLGSAPSGVPALDLAPISAELAELNGTGVPLSPGPIEAAPPPRAWDGPAMAGPPLVWIPQAPIQRLAPGPRTAGAPEARVSGDPCPSAFSAESEAPLLGPVIAAVPAPELAPLVPLAPSGLPSPAGDPPSAVQAACLGGLPAGPSQELPNPDWLGTLLWLALVGLDAVLALVEVLQQRPSVPAQGDLGTNKPGGDARFEPLARRLRLRQPLSS